MIQPFLNWRWFFALLAICIVAGTVFYSSFLAGKIASEERQKVEQWMAASKTVVNSTPGTDLTLPNLIRLEQQSIPIIETNEKDSITGFFNLDSVKAGSDASFLRGKLKQFKSNNPPVILILTDSPYVANLYYYGHTRLLDEIRYFPIIQLIIVAIFIFFVIYSISIRNKATQNQVWAGLAKETAHQLGTPISSLQGWVEMLRENDKNDAITTELQKDIDRLKLVSDRFGKIGSKPHLESINLVLQIENMVNYMGRRAPGRVKISFETHGELEIIAMVSAPLFDWVIENLLKNALDAMEGKGSIDIDIRKTDKEVLIDVTDSGKGITHQNIHKVFKPGFTTKKRGWGLGLSLSKRIVEQFHNGELFVKQSEPGKGTTFRIILKI
jgi:signal transduction histidine kinase